MTLRNKVLLVLGGASDIGRFAARPFAERGWSIQLAGRDAQSLQREADDIAIRYQVHVSVHLFDVLNTAAFEGFIDALPALPDVVVCVVGLLGDQSQAESSLGHASLIMRSNYEGPCLILGFLAERLLERGSGTIVGVSSVAGDRGRASNYVYGSAKSGYTAFLSGLRSRCAKRGVHVVTVKPGFVRTRMTEGMKLPKILTSSPELVGRQIYTSVDKKKNVIYSSLLWKCIMLLIRHIPEFIFKQLRR